MRKRINPNLIATTSGSQSKKNVAYKQRHDMLDKLAALPSSTNGMPRYYVLMFGDFEEIPASQVGVYEAGGFTIVEK